MRGALMAGFFASASVGSVLGVMLGGMIAARWGWKAAFGVVGFPGLVLALLYLFVRDYRTVELTPRSSKATARAGGAARHIVARADALAHDAVDLHRRAGAADRDLGRVVVAAQLPQPRPRHHARQDAGVKAALVVLCGALGSVVWGCGRRSRRALRARRASCAMLALLCLATMLVLGFAFGASTSRLALSAQAQFALIAARRLPDDLHGRPGRRRS